MLRFIPHASAPEAQAAASQLLQSTLDTLIQSHTPVLLLLSGGSNIPVATAVERNILHHPSVTRLVLDERFTADPQLNNSLQLQAAGIDVLLTVPEAQESLETFAQRFALLLQTWLSQHPNGQVVCTLGMGADGHIAGISPFPHDLEKFDQLFLKTNELATGYRGGLEPAERVTVTFPFLLKMGTLIGCITGNSKQAVFHNFLDTTTSPHQHPVQLLHLLPGSVTLCTDLQVP